MKNPPKALWSMSAAVAAALTLACQVRADFQLPQVPSPEVPRGHEYIIGLTEEKGKLVLITTTEAWEAEFLQPSSFNRVFDPNHAGVRMHEGSLSFYDSSADLYYFAGGLLDTRIYAYNRNSATLIGEGALLNLADVPGGIAVSDGMLYATSPGAVNVYSVNPVGDVYPLMTEFGVGLLENAQAVAFDGDASGLYVLDTGTQQVFHFALEADSERGIAAGDVLGSFTLVSPAANSVLLYADGRIFTTDGHGGGVVYDAATGAQLAIFQTTGELELGRRGKPVALVSPDGTTLFSYDFNTRMAAYDLTRIDGPGPIFDTDTTSTLETPFSSTGVVTILGNGGSLTLMSGASHGEIVNVGPGNELIISREASLETPLLRVLGGETPAHVSVQGDAGSRGILSVKEATSFGGHQTGYLALDGGILQAAAEAHVLVPLQLLASGGWLDSNGHDLYIEGPISGEGDLTKIGVGTAILSGENTWTGDTWVQAGALQFANRNAPSESFIHIASGAGVVYQIGGENEFTEADVQALFSSDPGMDLESGARVGVDIHNVWGGNYLFSGSLTEEGVSLGFFKRGAGTLTLTGANTYSGGTGIEEGAIHFTRRSTLPDNQLTVQGGARAIFSVGGAEEFDQADIAALAVGTGSTGFLSGSWLGFDTSNAVDGRFTLADSLANPNHGASALGLLKLGAGTLVLEGQHSYSGGTQILDGFIEFSSEQSLGAGSVTLDGGGLRWAIGNTVDISNRLNPLGPAGAHFDTNGNDVTFASNLSGSGGLTKSGAGTLSLLGNNPFSGPLTVSQGTLGFASKESIGTGGINVYGGGLRWLGDVVISSTVRTEGTVTFDTNGHQGAIETLLGNGTLIKAGSGELTVNTPFLTLHVWDKVIVEGGTLRADLLYTNTVTVRSGATLATGNTGWSNIHGVTTVQSGGHLATLQEGATLRFTDGLTLEDGVHFDLMLSPDADFHTIWTSNLMLAEDGRITLNLTAGNGFIAGTYRLIQYGTSTGIGLDSFVFGSVIEGYMFDVVYQENAFAIVATAVPEPSASLLFVPAAAAFLIFRRRTVQLCKSLFSNTFDVKCKSDRSKSSTLYIPFK